MSAELVVSGRDTAFWKRGAVLAGSAGVGILLSDALVEKIVGEDVDDEETEGRDEAELWRGGLQVVLGLLGGRVLYGYSRDAAVGVAVGVAGKGVYRIADGLGAVDKVEEWFGLGDEEEENGETVTAHACPTGQTWNETAQACRAATGLPAGQRSQVIVGEVLPRVGMRR